MRPLGKLKTLVESLLPLKTGEMTANNYMVKVRGGEKKIGEFWKLSTAVLNLGFKQNSSIIKWMVFGHLEIYTADHKEPAEFRKVKLTIISFFNSIIRLMT